jgi:hypothetical protein
MVHKVVDPLDPQLRIQRLLDPGTDSLLLERTDCGLKEIALSSLHPMPQLKVVHSVSQDQR